MRKFKIGALSVLSLVALTVSTASIVTAVNHKNNTSAIRAVTGDEPGNYYDSISSTASGTQLLSNLQSLNKSKRKKTVGYGNLFNYYPTTDGNGSKIYAFYDGSLSTQGSMNREHVWPNSRGGGSKNPGSVTTVDQDIHVTRPTLTADNSGRGNSFYVEGMNHGSNGWDPYIEKGTQASEYYRGACARIIFYCMVADPGLKLYDTNVEDAKLRSMGKLSDLLKWNLNYPLSLVDGTTHEIQRNREAQKIQGNRNPFIDHPEYACQIWGNTNATTKAICKNNVVPPVVEKDPPTSITLNKTNLELHAGQSDTLSAFPVPNTADGQVTWSSSNPNIASVSDSGVVNAIKQGGPVLITATSKKAPSVSATCTVNVLEALPSTLKTVSYTINNHTLTDQYGWKEWTSAENSNISGESFIYGGTTDKMQFSKKKASYYSYNITAMPGPIRSVTVTLNSGNTPWTVVTSATSFGQMNGAPTGTATTGPTDITTTGSKFTTSSGSNDKYFAVCYKGSGASYLDKIEVEYEDFSGGDTPTPPETSTITGVSINGGNVTMNVGDTRSFTASVTGTGSFEQTVNWSLQNVNPSNCISLSNNKITANAAGTATLKATSTQDASKSATVQIEVVSGAPVTPTVTGVSIVGGDASITVGGSKAFQANVTGTGNYDPTVKWSLNNVTPAGAATLSGNTVNGVSAGNAKLTATSIGDSTKSATINITISAAASGDYTLVKQASDIAVGDQVVIATGLGASDLGVTGQEGKKDAATSIAKADWIVWTVESKDANTYLLVDNTGSQYIQKPTGNEFKLMSSTATGTKANFVFNANGYASTDDRILYNNTQSNGGKRFYGDKTNDPNAAYYLPFYVYKFSSSTGPDVPPGPVPTPTSEYAVGVTKPISGGIYKFGLTSQNINYYITGAMQGFYFARTEEWASAVDVKYTDRGSGKCTLQIVSPGESLNKYIAVALSADNKHVNVLYVANETLLDYDSTNNSFGADIVGYIGTGNKDGRNIIGDDGTHSTLSADPVAGVSEIAHLYEDMNPLVLEWANNNMHMGDTNYDSTDYVGLCDKGVYDTAKAALLALEEAHPGAISCLKSVSNFNNAKLRYEAWARANNDFANAYSNVPATNVFMHQNNSNTIIIVVISIATFAMLSVVAILIKRRKKSNN